jgi:DNA-binding GntR family transcriptional regulator
MEPSDLQLRLARRIVDHARWTEMAAGAHLAEQTLAATFQVSRSPIRRALTLLHEHGLVERAPNRGYFLAEEGARLDPGALETLTSEEEALYRRLVSELMDGALGEAVTTAELQRRYATSRATVSRLMTYLRGEGLIEPREGHGWRFLPALTSPEAYDASYRFRRLVEPAALLEPGFTADATELGRLTRSHHRLLDGGIEHASYVLLFDVDAAFHAAIGAWSGNTFLHQSIEQQNRVRRLTEYEYYADRERMRESTREHLAILDAIAAGDLPRASDLMRDHIDASWGLRPSFPEAPGQSSG